MKKRYIVKKGNDAWDMSADMPMSEYYYVWDTIKERMVPMSGRRLRAICVMMAQNMNDKENNELKEVAE